MEIQIAWGIEKVAPPRLIRNSIWTRCFLHNHNADCKRVESRDFMRHPAQPRCPAKSLVIAFEALTLDNPLTIDPRLLFQRWVHFFLFFSYFYIKMETLWQSLCADLQPQKLLGLISHLKKIQRRFVNQTNQLWYVVFPVRRSLMMQILWSFLSQYAWMRKILFPGE